MLISFLINFIKAKELKLLNDLSFEGWQNDKVLSFKKSLQYLVYDITRDIQECGYQVHSLKFYSKMQNSHIPIYIYFISLELCGTQYAYCVSKDD